MANDPFQKLKSTVNRGITTINVKTSSSLEKTKLKTHIDSLEGEVQKLFYSIGELSYTQWSGGEDATEELKGIFETIQSKKNEIEELKGQIDAIDQRDSQILGTARQGAARGTATVCPSCGASYDTPVNFCRKCGQRLN